MTWLVEPARQVVGAIPTHLRDLAPRVGDRIALERGLSLHNAAAIVFAEDMHGVVRDDHGGADHVGRQWPPI